LKKNTFEDAVFPLVPCCFEKPQLENNREKILKMTMGVDIVSTKRKDNIIQKHHIIRHPGQLGVLPGDLQSFFVSNYPMEQVYRVGMNWSPYSFLECIQFAQTGGKSMPIVQWYPAHLENLLYKHPGLFASCVPFHSIEDVLFQVKHATKTFWVDPRMFLHFLEQVYDMRIFVWTQSPDQKRHTLLRSDRPLKKETTRCIYIVQHYGGRMDRLTGKLYPQCELLECHSVFDLTMTKLSPHFSILRSLSVPAVLPTHRFLQQALFPTGRVMALRSASLTFWIEPPSMPSMDLDFWDPYPDAITRAPSTAALREEFRRVGAVVDPVVSRYRSTRRAYLIWHVEIMGRRALTITEDIARHGIDEVVPGGRVDIVDTAPIWIVSVFDHHSNRPTTGLMEAFTPTAMMRNYSVMHMIRDVAFYRFLTWLRTDEVAAFETVPWNEKLELFFRRYTKVDAKHYHTDIFPAVLPSTYQGAEELCCQGDILLLPTASTTSRLFYYLQWILFYKKTPPTPPLHTNQRPSAFLFSGQYQNRDPRVLTMPFSNFATLV